MTVIYDALSNPINQGKTETLKRVYSVVGAKPVVLLGAFARDLIFDHVHGIEVPRATMDIDTCVQMTSWEDFRAACEELKAIGFKNEEEEHPEKFFDTNGQEVDLLPFGSLSKDGKTIVWPQDESPWSICGIQEAYEHANLIKVGELELRVVPPCAMVYLKIFSIYDRPDDRRKKDTGDIQFVLENYLAVAGRERLRSDGSDGDVMGLVAGNLEKAAARMAGRDMGKILSEDSGNELSKIFRVETESGSRCQIAHELAGFHKGRFQEARAILVALKDGFEEVRN